MATPVILPRLMSIGENACDEIPSILASLHLRRPLIVTDRMMVQLRYATRIVDTLASAGIEADVFDDTVPEPTVASISAGVKYAKKGDFDCIIGLGGGSPIDSAKAIAVLARHGGQMRDYKYPRITNDAGLPLIAVPTTAGTGSEVTRFTIITDEATDEKMLCVGLAFMPMAALMR
ncbi:iron-containing alcohol dehydrogenase, partial [Pseudomonas sp.]|uniref:iron-containing alcohol dehydrogenase n=1 Tax=Pseudomonas sp. TaxID=306 RepID=UPI002588421C